MAGIAHIKETKENEHLYYEINRDLAFETAQKAKADGVSQFIFMSSMSVYGIESGVITKDTKPSPKSYYGKSKLEAEGKISLLVDNAFILAVLRPPMIYGKGCKGNYQRLSEFAKKAPIFPDIHNERSMIYIDNLSEFIRNLIDEQTRGLFLPQNKEYVCTSELVKEIAKNHGKNIRKVYILNPLIRFFQPRIKTLNKVFGDFVYLQDNSLCQTIGFKESVKVSEQ